MFFSVWLIPPTPRYPTPTQLEFELHNRQDFVFFTVVPTSALNNASAHLGFY